MATPYLNGARQFVSYFATGISGGSSMLADSSAFACKAKERLIIRRLLYMCKRFGQYNLFVIINNNDTHYRRGPG
jgi:hypothetical protein